MADIAFRFATLGLGGNLGDPVHAMAAALRQLDARADCRVSVVSRVYCTPPWGKTDQADFYNACAGVMTVLTPETLLDACLNIEKDMKRVRNERWGPRTIDIDVLTFEGVEQSGGRLDLPHPRMTERGFVLMPLADFAPDLQIAGRPVSAWLSGADVQGITDSGYAEDWWKTL